MVERFSRASWSILDRCLCDITKVSRRYQWEPTWSCIITESRLLMKRYTTKQ